MGRKGKKNNIFLGGGGVVLVVGGVYLWREKEELTLHTNSRR